MRVLVVGSGGREHALAWHLSQHDGVEVRTAPGNGGTPANVPIESLAIDQLAAYAATERIDLTIVGPEAPLAAGLVDAFAARGLAVFGPTQAAARLESSKGWAKAFLQRHAIPTARAEIVGSEAAARQAVARSGLPVALKADGLAGGKGVFVIHTQAELDHALEVLFHSGALGAAAEHVLVEEYLEGPELSLLAFCDGEHLQCLPPARDYKRLLDGDRGPNTGGMGGVGRPEYAPPALVEELAASVLRPTLAGMAAEGTPYRGVLYAGLMLTAAGPRVIEFNCRFGDPECQLLLPLLETSLLEICQATLRGELDRVPIRWAAGQTYGVVLAAPGYPEAPRLGEPIAGLDQLGDDVLVFHAGTRRAHNQLVTTGGRVLTLVSRSRERVLAAAQHVQFAGKQFRSDIGLPQTVTAGASA